jgi:D-alanyl-D-alanine carboxypeptidase
MSETDFLSKRIYIDYFLAFLCVLGLAVFLSWPNKNISNTDNKEDAGESSKISFPLFAEDIKGKAAIVYDIKNKQIIFEKNADIQLPLASLTKLMTAFIAIENAPPTTIINIDKDALSAEGDSGLKLGDKWKLIDLVKVLLVNSSNDAARALANTLGSLRSYKKELGRKNFVKLMNEKAYELNLNQTYFLNETGLDENNLLSGGYGSAKDVAILMAKLLEKYPDIFDYTKKERVKIYSEQGSYYEARNTNKIVNDIPLLLGSKTGFTDLAGGNLAVVFNIDFQKPFVVVVLNSSAEERIKDVKKMVEATISYVTQIK